jgi:hypothetical protein
MREAHAKRHITLIEIGSEEFDGEWLCSFSLATMYLINYKETLVELKQKTTKEQPN